MKVCVIDDCGFIRHALVQDFGNEKIDCEEMHSIPKDLSKLEPFDVLVVDGDGIGNGTYHHGVDFLKDYAPNHKDKLLVHYSGLITKQNGDALKELGVFCIMKGYGTNTVIDAVVGFAKERGMVK